MTVGGDTRIKVRNSPYYTYDISNQYSDQKYSFNYSAENAHLHFKGDLTIVTEGGNNSVGINIKDKTHNTAGTDSITVDKHLSISSSGAQNYEHKTNLQTFPNSVTNYGIFLNNIASSTFNTAEITTESAGERVESIGTYLYDNSKAVFRGDVRYHTVADDAATEISALARKNSNLVYQKGLIADGKVVLNAVQGSSIEVNSTNDSDAVIQLDGSIVAGKTSAAKINNGNIEDMEQDNTGTKNLISVNLLNKDSHFTGINEYGNEGSRIDLTFASGARWNMTDGSHVSALTTRDGGMVDLTYRNTGAASGFRTLTADTLAGDGGIFRVNTDIAADKTDQVIIGFASGSHQLLVAPTGAQPDRQAMDSFIVHQDSGEASFTLANPGGKVDAGLYNYKLASRDAEGATEWYLTRGTSEDGTPDYSPTADAVLAMASAGAQNALYQNNLMDLRKRLGEVRDGVRDGLWVSVAGWKDNLSGYAGSQFRQEAYSVSFGLDHAINDNWLIGANLRATIADQKTHGHENQHATGDADSQGLNLYATWTHENGTYADFVASVDRYGQEITTHMLDGQETRGKYHNRGYGLSAEIGRKFAQLGNDKTWFIEPQAQLSWYHVRGDTFNMNNGMRIKQDDADSLTARVGIVAGRDLKLENDRKGQYYLKAGVNHELSGDQKVTLNDIRFEEDDIMGTRFYYGAGIDWELDKNTKFYGQIEREEGSHYTKEIEVRFGLKRSF